ncbi:ATP-binding cassette domain-containing protein [Streptomyces griseus]|uniref:ATP-binding cassette domain-containing protein n=1 Tax=Streptomyces griseus TaxID=1911 RepID=UPI000AB6D688|nr:ATP-binding cassette domain-containing protein [Streptomyces griseus]
MKAFGEVQAVDGIDLAVNRGMVYGILGPNGAGKTTTIHILSTLLRPDSGHASVLGHDVVREADAVRAKVSLTGQFASVDEDLTGQENLTLLARLMGYTWKRARSRATELLGPFGLDEAAGRQVKTYSGGMRRRLDIAVSLIASPELMILDEPTTGLDPHSRNEVWEIIRAVVEGGSTVLLTTQYLEEADQLAGRIAVIDRGKVIAEGTPGDLKASVGPGTLRVRVHSASDRPAAKLVLTRVLDVPIRLHSDPALLSAPIFDPAIAAHALGELASEGVLVTDFTVGQSSLDEVFLALTGHSASENTDVREGEKVA